MTTPAPKRKRDDSPPGSITDDPLWTVGDVTLISGDGVRFKVDKGMLSVGRYVCLNLINLGYLGFQRFQERFRSRGDHGRR